MSPAWDGASSADIRSLRLIARDPPPHGVNRALEGRRVTAAVIDVAIANGKHPARRRDLFILTLLRDVPALGDGYALLRLPRLALWLLGGGSCICHHRTPQLPVFTRGLVSGGVGTCL